MTAVPMNSGLTLEDAAELLRQDARARQRDSRARKAERAAAQERLLAEREAERMAVLAAKTERIAELEARLIETEERLGDAVTLLAVHRDVAGLQTRGASSENCHVLRLANGHFLKRFEIVSMRYWTCTAPEAVLRAQALIQAVSDRILTLPSNDDPVTITRGVTPPGTPVTQTVRNADRPMRIADRSHDRPTISVEEEAWIDAQDRSPYDPYEAQIAHIEALAEGGADDDVDDDGERF